MWCIRNGQLMFGTLHLLIDASSLTESLRITDSLIDAAAAKCMRLRKAIHKLPASLPESGLSGMQMSPPLSPNE